MLQLSLSLLPSHVIFHSGCPKSGKWDNFLIIIIHNIITRVPRPLSHHCRWSGLGYHCRDPPHVVGYTGVDTVLAPSTASVAKTGHPHHRPPATHLAQQRSARITGTRVRPTVSIPRAEHVVRDQIPPVRGPARPLSHYRYLLTTHILVPTRYLSKCGAICIF